MAKKFNRHIGSIWFGEKHDGMHEKQKFKFECYDHCNILGVVMFWSWKKVFKRLVWPCFF